MNAQELKTKIISANNAYRSGTAIMSDGEFDSLVEEYGKTVSPSEFEEFRNSLHETKGKVKHPFVMGSLNKLKTDEPETIIKFIDSTITSCLNVSAKVDGISCRIRYENGKLALAATRGDGSFGEDLTQKIKYVKGIPETINYGKAIDIRGELVIFRNDFAELTGFSNPRNACAGIMNRKETSKEYNVDDIRHVTFVPYTILDSEHSKVEQFSMLESFGFNTAWHTSIPKAEINRDTIVDKLYNWAVQDLSYEIDGVVISDDSYVNESKYRPDSQAAVKTNQLEVETTLVDITFEGPSKDGSHVPVAILEPVEIGGAIISRASVYNLDFIESMGFVYGCRVSLLKSGDIIPKITGIISKPDNGKKIEVPTVCNCCGSTLVRDGVNVRCANSECRDQKIYQITHFIKKLGVMNASFKTLDNFGIDSYDKLLSFVPSKSKKSETKFCDELREKVFTRSPADLFCSLNIRGLGETLQKKIVDHYGWDEIKLSVSAKCRPCDYFKGNLPEGIGQITFDKFLSSYQSSLEIVEKICSDVRYSYSATQAEAVVRSEVKGSVCFTGALNSMSRNQASALATKAGYEVKPSVSKGLTYLVTNDPFSGSSKNVKAQKVGTKIITEDQFLALVNNQESSIMDL